MRRALIFAAIALVAIVAGYGIYWHEAARSLEAGIARWAEARRAEGYEVSFAGPAIGGFPFRLEARLDDPVLASPPPSSALGAEPWRWQGPTLTLRARPWAPLDAEAVAPGSHDLALGAGEAARHFVLDASDARGRASFDMDGKLTEAEATLSDLLVVEDGAPDESLLAETAHVRVWPGNDPAADHTRPSLTFEIALADAVLPPGAATPLGRELQKLEVDGAVMGRIASHGAALKDDLAAWRDDGGTLELSRIVGYWGPLVLTGTGTFALDSALQPIGAMSTTLSGHEAAIDALVESGTVSPRDGSVAKIVLAVLAKPSPVDGQPELTAPITIQDGALWVGPARLMRLPPVEWP